MYIRVIAVDISFLQYIFNQECIVFTAWKKESARLGFEPTPCVHPWQQHCLAQRNANIQVFPASFYLDVNNDGVKDLLASPNVWKPGENHEVVWRYQNEGATNQPVFTKKTKRHSPWKAFALPTSNQRLQKLNASPFAPLDRQQRII